MLKLSESLNIQKVNEVFLRVIFEKIKPDSSFDFLAEIDGIQQVKTLLSFKKIHLKKTLLGRIHLVTKVDRVKKYLAEMQKPSETTGKAIGEEWASEESITSLNLKYRKLILIHQDKTFGMSMREIIDHKVINKVMVDLMDQFPESDVKKFVYLMGTRKLTKSKIINDTLKVANGGSQKGSFYGPSPAPGREKAYPSQGVVNFLKFLSEKDNSLNSDDNTSQMSDFSFGMSQLSAGSLSFLNF